MVARRGADTWNGSVDRNLCMNDSEKKILAHIAQNPRAKNVEIAKVAYPNGGKYANRTVSRTISQMLRKGILRREGSERILLVAYRGIH